MIGLNVRIGKAGDSGLFPEYLSPEYEFAGEAELVGFGILEKGTGRGRTSVAFVVRTPDGKHYVVESTARMLVNGMASATKGACECFGDDLNES